MTKTDKELAETAKKRMQKQNEYIKRTFDRVSVVMPKGYKELIANNSRGKSVNAFIVDAITERLENMGISTEMKEENENRNDFELPFL